MNRLALCLILISSTPLSETIIDQARRNRAIHSPAAPTLHEDSHGMHVQVVLEAACALTPMGLEQQALKTSLSRQLQTSRTLSSHLIKLPRAEDSHPSRAWTSRNGCHLESTRTVSGLAVGSAAALVWVHMCTQPPWYVPVVLHILGSVCECGRVDCFQVGCEQSVELLQTHTRQASFHLE